jgi:outer membrane protein OmpA-like peptidoglycan-associated protein
MRIFLLMLLTALMTMGCATKKYVEGEVTESETRTAGQIDRLKTAVEATQTEIRDLAKELNLQIDGLEHTTKSLEESDKRLERIASDNNKVILQMGQLSFQKTLSDSEASFKSESAELTDAARTELDKFAELLVQQNKLAHIEIQGHTDNRGSESYNLKLGLNRAEAVREYLYKSHDIPLHLMSVISFGPEAPIADNGTREGRAKNRRVTLVVRIQVAD